MGFANKQEEGIALQLEEVRAKELTGAFVAPTTAEEEKVIRKLDARLLPLVFVLYTLSILDRSNLGNAKLAGMSQDIDLSGNHYQWLSTVFYIAYVLSQPLIIGWKQFKPHHWATFCVLFWGFVASIQASAYNWSGLMACRAFLGVAEACFGPGVPMYLSFFYPRERVGFRQGIFISGAAMANVYGGLLAYGITQIRGTLAPWKILFLIEGLPTCCFAIFTWFFLPDSIRAAKFLTDREKEVALHMAGRNQRIDVGHEQKVSGKELLQGYLDPKSWLPALCYFGVNVSYASLPLFSPTIISQIGAFDTVESQALSAPPYALAFFTIILFCYLTDKLKMRGPFVIAGALLGGIGFVINATTTGAAPRYFSLFLSTEIFTSVSILITWVSNLHASESKRAGAYTILNLVGQCGPILGTNIFPSSEAPYYREGMWISAAFCFFVAIVAGALTLWLIHENKLMAEAGVPEVEDFEDTSAPNEEGETPRRPQQFRHIW